MFKLLRLFLQLVLLLAAPSLLAATTTPPTLAPAALAPVEWAGLVKAAVGVVSAERDGKIVPLAVGDRVYARDKIITGKDSRAAITLRDDTLISCGANSQLVLKEFSFDPGTQSGGLVVNILRGVTAFVSGLVAKSSPQAMKVTTPTSTIGIRGTEFIVEVDEE